MIMHSSSLSIKTGGREVESRRRTEGQTHSATKNRFSKKQRQTASVCLQGTSQLVLSHQWITADKAGCFYQRVERKRESKRE